MRGSSRIFRTLVVFRYLSAIYGLIEVPKGTLTDGASIPRIFWNILSPFGEYFAAALIHDYLYSPANNRFTRAEADLILLEAMKALNVPAVKRVIIYRAVRLFGWRSYKGKK